MTRLLFNSCCACGPVDGRPMTGGIWRSNEARVRRVSRGCTEMASLPVSSRLEIAVDWRLTTQPHSDEQVDTQLKSRSLEVLTPQHSDNLGATQHNSAKLGQFGLLICGLWVRFPPGSPLIPNDLATSTSRFTEIIVCWLWVRLSLGSPMIRQHIRGSRDRPSLRLVLG
jgi:hypothetical protein